MIVNHTTIKDTTMNTIKHATLKQAMLLAKGLSMSIRKNDGEYRINYKNGTENTAYYTTDIVDAIQTMVAMNRIK